MGCYFLLQRIFPIQGLNPGLLHGRQILYCLSYREISEGLPFLLQKIFPIQGLNPGLLHGRQILYCLSYREISEGLPCHSSG